MGAGIDRSEAFVDSRTSALAMVFFAVEGPVAIHSGAKVEKSSFPNQLFRMFCIVAGRARAEGQDKM